MIKFASLLDALVYSPSRNRKLCLIADYLREAPDPDRGWVLAALTETLTFPSVKASTIRKLMAERVDPILWKLSRDFVGDTAETASLLWPEPEDKSTYTPTISDVVNTLNAMTRSNASVELAKLLNGLNVSNRHALIKLATGGMRVGVSARLAKTAFAQAFAVDIEDVEEYWHGVDPPYAELFAWAAGEADPPDLRSRPLFRPFMLALPLEETKIELADFAAEWKWDGIRVQLVHVENDRGGETRLYSRGGENISDSFPELIDAFRIPAVLDGELLVRGNKQGGVKGGAASFNALQQRLGRKSVDKKIISRLPAFVRLYDALIVEGEDLRKCSWENRRAQLEKIKRSLPEKFFDISPIVEFRDLDHLEEMREGARSDAIEGLMLKRRDSHYVAGRKVGGWYKWKRDPLLIDCVLMYAQRGSGRRSSFFSDYTFGCWNGDPNAGAELLPVGKAYFGFTDAELKKLDKLIRQKTVNRFGPVREIERCLVFEIAFDSVHTSKRHKSGLAMRFPRIHRIRWDKPVHEADSLQTLKALKAD